MNVLSREVLDEMELKRRVTNLNTELVGKDESALTPSQWSKYPFLICQYRGIHYFKDCFTDAQRKDHMETVHLNRLSVAPAVYYMLKSTVGKPLFPANYQMARETDLDREKLEIREIWNTFKSMKDARAYWKGEKAKPFDNAALMMNERMATKYNTFKSEAKAGDNSFTAILKEKNVIGYPAYATSDLPLHALKYAYGLKKMADEKPQTEKLDSPRLRPDYLMDGTPRHPHLGKVYLAMFTPLQMLQHSVQHVAGAHDRRDLDVGSIAFERESSALGAVQPEIVFYEEVLTVPDLSSYDSAEATNSGYTQSQWNKWKRWLNEAYSITDMPARTKVLEEMEGRLLKDLVKVKSQLLLKIAVEEAAARGSYLVWRSYDQVYGIAPEVIRDGNKPLHMRDDDRSLLSSMNEYDLNRLEHPQPPSSSSSSSSSLSSVKLHGQYRLVRSIYDQDKAYVDICFNAESKLNITADRLRETLNHITNHMDDYQLANKISRFASAMKNTDKIVTSAKNGQSFEMKGMPIRIYSGELPSVTKIWKASSLTTF